MTTIVGNRGQLWTSTLSPHFPFAKPPFRLSRVIFLHAMWCRASAAERALVSGASHLKFGMLSKGEGVTIHREALGVNPPLETVS